MTPNVTYGLCPDDLTTVRSRPEDLILQAMEAGDELFTISRLCAVTALDPDDVRRGLVLLREQGLVSRLNTVIESWVSRATDRRRGSWPVTEGLTRPS